VLAVSMAIVAIGIMIDWGMSKIVTRILSLGFLKEIEQALNILLSAEKVVENTGMRS
jgi:hypothetical protein